VLTPIFGTETQSVTDILISTVVGYMTPPTCNKILSNSDTRTTYRKLETQISMR